MILDYTACNVVMSKLVQYKNTRYYLGDVKKNGRFCLKSTYIINFYSIFMEKAGVNGSKHFCGNNCE